MSPVKAKFAFYTYRVLARFAEILPDRAIGPVAKVMAFIGVLLNPKKRDLVASHLRRITGHEPSIGLIRASFASYMRYWLVSLRLPTIDVNRLNDIVKSDTFDKVHETLAEGRGIIFALPHIGNWDIGGAWVANMKIPFTVVVEELEPPELFQWFKDFRESLGMRVITNGPKVASEITTILKNAGSVALLCDRDVDGTGANFEFFGEVTKLPKGPATLALRTGAVVYPTAVYETKDGFNAFIGEEVTFERTGKLKQDVELMTNEINRRLENLIRQAPEQWHVFQPNWPSD